MKEASKRRKGFTLIELLVVIVIISTLAAILLPALNKAQVRAKVAAAMSTIKQIETACHSYEQDTGNNPPDVYTDYLGEPVNPNNASYLYNLLNAGPNYPYFAPKDKDLSAARNDLLVYLLDPWKVPYVYVCCPFRRSLDGGNTYKWYPGNRGGINVFSLGPDKICESCTPLPTGSQPWQGKPATHGTGTQGQEHWGGCIDANCDDPRNW